MHYKSKYILIILIVGLAFLLTSCASMLGPTESNFEKPQVELDSFIVPQYDGYWYYGGNIQPTKGEAGDHGAPLPMSFLFKIDNPNPYPVTVDGFRFTVSFEDFDLMTVNNNDVYMIPAESTDYIRANTMITTRSALLSLLVTGGFKLKELGWSPWEAMERWWTKVPNLEIPVEIKDGSMTFKADDITKVVPLSAVYP